MKEQFKNFIKNKPYLINYIKDGTMTWQKFYEIYSLYGEDESIWNKYEEKRSSINIKEILKKENIDSIKEKITEAQKALDFVQELTSKSSDIKKIIPTSLKPINKFFED